jgi:hypothetical protein
MEGKQEEINTKVGWVFVLKQAIASLEEKC